MRRRPSFALPTLLALVLAGCTSLETRSESAELRVAPLTVNWQYRWGDPPAAERAAWLSGAEEGWQQFTLPKRPPGRDGAKVLWIRARLPDQLPAAPFVYARYVDRAFEAWVGGERVFAHGTLDPEPSVSAGRPWILMPLGDGAQGQWLTLRIWSDQAQIGPFGRFYVGTRQGLMQAVVRTGLDEVILGSVLLALTLVALAMLGFGIRPQTVGALAGMSAACAAYTFSNASSLLKQLLFNDPPFWFALNLTAQGLVPAFYCMVFASMTDGWLKKATRWAVKLQLAFVVVGMAGPAFGLYPLAATTLPFNVLVALAMVFGLVAAARSAVSGAADIRWFLAGLLCAAVAAGHDLLVDERILLSETHLAGYGLSGFVALIGLYLARSVGSMVLERAGMAEEVSRQNGQLVAARDRMGATAEQVAVRSGSILTAAREQVDRSAQLNEANRRTNTSVAEIAVASRQVASHAERMIEAARRSESLSSEGRAAVEAAVEGMKRLSATVQLAVQRAESLAAHQQRIGEIVDAVRELSDRSGILAINASLEAARAGAGGAGFATVAREMKGLADRSRDATLKVRQILGQVEKEISGVRAGVEAGSQGSLEAARLAGRAGETIAGLAEAIASSAGLASQIAEGTREQSTNLEQIADAIAQGARALEATLDGTRRIEQEAGVLTALSGELGQQAR